MSRTIFHLDLDVFFVAVERLLNPGLNNQPVIVSPGTERSVVSTASYEARKFGVHSAMPMSQARRLCPQAIVCPGNFRAYKKYSKAFFNILKVYSPEIEPASVDEAYLDYSGCQKLFGGPLEAATTIQQHVKNETGMDVSIGVASCKLVAKIASGLAKPAGLLVVRPGHEEAILRQLPIGRLMGVGPKTEPRMKKLGIRRIGDLLRVSKSLLNKAFGSYGAVLQEMARGQDHSLVSKRENTKSISQEETFAQDLTDPQSIHSALHRLVCEVGFRLRKYGYKAQTVVVKVRYADFSLHTRSMKFKAATNLDKLLYSAAVELLAKVWTRRVRIRLIGFVGQQLKTGEQQQLDLLKVAENEKLRNLHTAADKLKQRYGYHSINWASLLKQKRD